MKIRIATLLILAITFLATLAQARVNTPNITNNQENTSKTFVLAMVEDFNWQGTIEYYLERLEDPDPFIRVKAVQALGEVQTPLALQTLLSQMHDENFYVRAYTAEALAKVGIIDSARTVSRLLSGLRDEEPYVRAMTARALGELKASSAIKPLKVLLNDDHEMVRQQANWALKEIVTPPVSLMGEN